jgi:hypothetical protein
LNPIKKGFLVKEGAVIKFENFFSLSHHFISKLTARQQRNWLKRWFVLLEDGLYYFSDEKSPAPKGVIPLQGCLVQDAFEFTKKAHSFGIFEKEGKRRTFFLLAATEEDKESWMTSIQEQCDFQRVTYDSFVNGGNGGPIK